MAKQQNWKSDREVRALAAGRNNKAIQTVFVGLFIVLFFTRPDIAYAIFAEGMWIGLGALSPSLGCFVYFMIFALNKDRTSMMVASMFTMHLMPVTVIPGALLGGCSAAMCLLNGISMHDRWVHMGAVCGGLAAVPFLLLLVFRCGQ